MDTLAALATTLPDPPRRAGPLKPVLRGLLRRNPASRIRPAEARLMLLRAAGEEVGRRGKRLVARRRRTPEPMTAIVSGDPGRAPTVVLTPGRPAVEAPAPPPVRRRRGRVLIAVVGAAVVAAAVSAAVAGSSGGTRQSSSSAPSPATAGAASVAPADPFLGGPVCPTASPTEFRPASRQPGWNALIPGWVWYHDPGRYRVAVPGGWRASSGAEGLCFRDAVDGRWLGVTTWTSGGNALGHVEERQQELTSDGGAAGYALVKTAPVAYYQDGADWEFRFDSRTGVPMHGVIRDFLVGPGRGYSIAWCTTEFDWTTNLDNWRLVIASFAVDA
jgi:hypothetical protein